MADFNALKAKVDFSEVDKARDSFKGLLGDIKAGEVGAETFGQAMKLLENPILAVASALAIATGGAIALGFKSIEAADKLNDMAARTGQTIEYLQTLGNVAVKSGTDLDTMASVLESINKKSLAGGTEGKKVAEAYKFLGIEARDAAGNLKDATTLGEEGAKALQNLGNSADATAAFVTAFGTSALKVVPTLAELNKNLDEEYDFLASVGALMDSNLAKAADGFNDRMTDLGSVFTGLGNDIARTMLPLLKGVADVLINSATNSGILSTAFDVLKGAVFVVTGALKGLLTFFAMVDNGFSNIVQTIALGGKVIWAALTGNWDEIPKLWDNYKTRIIRTNQEAADAVAGIWSEVEAAPISKEDFKKGKKTGGPAFVIPGKEEKEPRPLRESDAVSTLLAQEKAIIKLNQAFLGMIGIQEETNAAQLEAEIAAGKYNATLTKLGATEEQLAKMRANASFEDEMKRRNELAALSLKAQASADASIKAARESSAEQVIATNVLKRYGSTQEDVNLALAEYRLNQTEEALNQAVAIGAKQEMIIQLQNELRVRRELAGLAKTAKKNADDERGPQDGTAGFLNGWTKAFNDYKKQASSAAQTGADVFKAASGHMEGALTSFITTGKLNFKEFTASILSDIAQIMAKKAIAGLVGSMFGGGYANGGAFSGGAQFFANGGVVSTPTAFGMSGGRTGVMGEAGPEAIMPLKRGADGKLGVVAAGSSSGEVIINNNMSITIGTVDSEERKQELLRAVQQQMVATSKATIAGELRQGGMLNRRQAA
jgi:hypothetical protein